DRRASHAWVPLLRRADCAPDRGVLPGARATLLCFADTIPLSAFGEGPLPGIDGSGAGWMVNSSHPAAVPGPKSLVEGVEQAAVDILGITRLNHRSALHRISPFNGT